MSMIVLRGTGIAFCQTGFGRWGGRWREFKGTTFSCCYRAVGVGEGVCRDLLGPFRSKNAT